MAAAVTETKQVVDTTPAGLLALDDVLCALVGGQAPSKEQVQAAMAELSEDHDMEYLWPGQLYRVSLKAYSQLVHPTSA